MSTIKSMLRVQVDIRCATKLHSNRFERQCEEIPRGDRLSTWKRVVVSPYITVCTKANVELKRNAQLQIPHSVEKDPSCPTSYKGRLLLLENIIMEENKESIKWLGGWKECQATYVENPEDIIVHLDRISIAMVYVVVYEYLTDKMYTCLPEPSIPLKRIDYSVIGSQYCSSPMHFKIVRCINAASISHAIGHRHDVKTGEHLVNWSPTTACEQLPLLQWPSFLKMNIPCDSIKFELEEDNPQFKDDYQFADQSHTYLPYMLEGDDVLRGKEARPNKFKSHVVIGDCKVEYAVPLLKRGALVRKPREFDSLVDHRFKNWNEFYEMTREIVCFPSTICVYITFMYCVCFSMKDTAKQQECFHVSVSQSNLIYSHKYLFIFCILASWSTCYYAQHSDDIVDRDVIDVVTPVLYYTWKDFGEVLGYHIDEMWDMVYPEALMELPQQTDLVRMMLQKWSPADQPKTIAQLLELCDRKSVDIKRTVQYQLVRI